jgi:hypothetical protein
MYVCVYFEHAGRALRQAGDACGIASGLCSRVERRCTCVFILSMRARLCFGLVLCWSVYFEHARKALRQAEHASASKDSGTGSELSGS